MRKDGPSFLRWEITPLKTANTSSGITLQRYTISHLQPGWRYIRPGITFDPVQKIIVRTRGLMCIGKRWLNPQPLSSGWMISLRGSFYEITPTSTRRSSSPSGIFLPPTQKVGHVGLIFSRCDPRDKRKDMGKNLAWKAKEKRPNPTGDDCSSSSSSDGEDEEYLEDEVGPGLGSLTNHKGKSANQI